MGKLTGSRTLRFFAGEVGDPSKNQKFGNFVALNKDIFMQFFLKHIYILRRICLNYFQMDSSSEHFIIGENNFIFLPKFRRPPNRQYWSDFIHSFCRSIRKAFTMYSKIHHVKIFNRTVHFYLQYGHM